MHDRTGHLASTVAPLDDLFRLVVVALVDALLLDVSKGFGAGDHVLLL